MCPQYHVDGLFILQDRDDLPWPVASLLANVNVHQWQNRDTALLNDLAYRLGNLFDNALAKRSRFCLFIFRQPSRSKFKRKDNDCFSYNHYKLIRFIEDLSK